MRDNTRALFTLILIHFWMIGWSSGVSYERIFETVTIENGLGSDHILTMIRDSNGFIWIGTNNGLNKYDGYKTLEFFHEDDNPHSLSNNWISSLLEDHDGNIWVSTTGGGLNKYDPNTGQFTKYLSDHEDSTTISSDIITTIYQDSKNRIWLGTMEGLSRLNSNEKGFMNWDQHDECLECISNVSAIVEDPKGNLWIGDEVYGLYYFDTQSYQFSEPSNVVNVNQGDLHINDLLLRRDQLWIGTDHGLMLFNTLTSEFETIHNEHLKSVHISKLKMETDNSLWICTAGDLSLIHI